MRAAPHMISSRGSRNVAYRLLDRLCGVVAGRFSAGPGPGGLAAQGSYRRQARQHHLRLRQLIVKVSYTSADAAYLDKRRLRRHARVLHLWAMAVGAVISGDFFGWNYGMAAGGFGGMLLAVFVMTAMYLGLCFSIAEMSPALPHAGGAYSFARTAMGPWGGYITGLAENMEYVLTPAVIVVGIGGYLSAVFGSSAAWEPLWWLLCYAVFVALNVWGVEMSFRVSVLVTLIAIAVLAVFWVGAAPRFDLARWASPYFPRGANKPMAALIELPFALWLYLGIEQLPLAAEESHDPQHDMPRGILYGLLTLIAISFLTVVLSAGIAPGRIRSRIRVSLCSSDSRRFSARACERGRWHYWHAPG